MRVVLLASASSIHAIRWANGLSARGVDIHVVSLHRLAHSLDSAVTLHLLPFGPPCGYVAAAPFVRRLLKRIRPDLLNAHYATGYGLLSRLSGFSPSLLSVWGSDVYDFPGKSGLHRWLLHDNLQCATQIGSTSHCMARKVHEIFSGASIAVTPFGVDEARFHNNNTTNSSTRRGLTIGTVKTLAPKYGIDTLIDAFARLRKCEDLPPVTLEITGDGPQRSELESLVHRLGVGDSVVFHGAVAYDQVPAMLARLDIFVALSRLDSESFGVAAVEAAMCGLPVVVSDAEGLAEVVENGKSGFVVPRNDPAATVKALRCLISSQACRQNMGHAGHARALTLYTWEKSLDIMIDTYKQTIEMGKQMAGGGRQ